MALFGLLSLWQLVLIAICVPVVYRIFIAAKDPLHDVPGPLLARFTRLWFLKAILNRDFEKTHIALHKKYGPIVRLAPGMYTFDDPEATSIIYGTTPTFPKGKFYSVFQPPGEAHQNIYSSASNRYATEIRKKYKPAYDLIAPYESCIDECTEIFTSKLKELSSQDNVDFGWWLKCFATDVNGQITFGKRFGNLDEGKDIGNIGTALEDRKNYGATVGIFPNLHSWTWMLIAAMSFLTRQIDYTLVFSAKCIEDHQEELRKDKPAGPTAMLTRFLDAHNLKPDYFTYNDVLIGGLTGLVAGADTSEISMSSLFHYVLESPEVLKKLRAEVDGTDSTWEKARELPYLNAVMKEAHRIHSPVGTPLWREVPESGTTLCGRFFPGGTQVGVNIWVSHYSQAFAPDPEVFRPERWLEADPKKLALMERRHMVFGAGPRNCQGSNLALMIMSKIVPVLVKEFDFDITGTWETWNNWFVNGKGLTGKIRIRE